MNQATCALAGADGPCGPARARGWCVKHYERWRRYGDPLKAMRLGHGVILTQLQAAASATTDECIILATRGASRPTVKLDGKLMTASRAAWIIAHDGEDPGDAQVLHTCHRGEEGCINLRHLYLGDHARNMQDKYDAGRQTGPRGEDNASAKLTAEAVRQIRRRYSAGEATHQQLAAEYGVRPGTVGQAVRRVTWRWLDD